MLIQKIAMPWVTLYTSIAIASMIAIIMLVNKIQERMKRE
jgi:hypothetical protein